MAFAARDLRVETGPLGIVGELRRIGSAHVVGWNCDRAWAFHLASLSSASRLDRYLIALRVLSNGFGSPSSATYGLPPFIGRTTRPSDVGRKSDGNRSMERPGRPAGSWRDVQPPFTSPWLCDEARKLTLRRGNVEAATTVRGMLEPNLGSHCCCRPGRTPHLGHRRPRCPGHDGPATRQGQTLPTAAGGDVVSSSSQGQTAAHSSGNSH